MQRSGIGVSQVWSKLFTHPGNRCYHSWLGSSAFQVQDDGSIHTVAYTSQSADIHECKYGISDLETMGLVWAVRYFVPIF